MSFSVVIPTKNEEKLLPRLLRSLAEQSVQPLEVIVADAGSDDATPAIATSFGAEIVSGGLPGVGRNRGAAASLGDYIIFLDADVTLPYPHFLRDCWQEMERRRLDVTTCRVQAIQGTRTDKILHYIYNVYTRATENIIPHAPGFCLLVKREVHQAIHGFDETVVFAEDMDYVQRAAKQGFCFGILDNFILSSVRRLEKEGRLKLALKFIFAEFRILTLGPFKGSTPFTYEFDHRGQQPSSQKTSNKAK